eukprot:jgi/Bigna1/84188/fgenesh1_pg.125_\
MRTYSAIAVATYLHLVMVTCSPDTPTPITRVVSSNGGHRLTPESSIDWQYAENCPADSFEILHTEEGQVIGGFGASMTESSAVNLNSLSEEMQEELLEIVFGKTGARVSAVKATMLANDFSAQGPWSTYDDVENDVKLEHFSIKRDLRENGTLTFIKRAISAGFEGTIQAYMDYPPDWMLDDRKNPANASIREDLYDVLAQYYAAYVEAYARHGVTIDFLECFNEPTDSYTRMAPSQLARFLGKHIGPLFDQLGLRNKTKLTYGGQCNREMAAEYIPAIMADRAAAKYMDVLAYHGYDCQYGCNDSRQNYDKISQVHEKFAHIPMWMTEICYAYNGDDPNCTSSATMSSCTDYPRDPKLAPPLPRLDFEDGATWGHRIIKDLQSGASGWIYWNMFLDMDGGPFAYSPEHNDGPDNYQHPVVVVDGESDRFHLTGLFWFLSHFSRFVRPGSVFVKAREPRAVPPPDGVSMAAFHKKDSGDARYGNVVQVVNKGAQEKSIAICSKGYVARMKVPGFSITTGQWK